MVHEMTRVDTELWERFLALDEPTLTRVVGTWLDGGAIRAILERRNRMVEDVERMVEERGKVDVFVRFRAPSAVR